MSRSRRTGTAWETAVVGYLRRRGWPHAERRALGGAHDRGDIAGVVGVVIEAKAVARVDLAAFVDEAHIEAINDRADMGVVWLKRRGRTSPAEAYVVMNGQAFTRLLSDAGYGGGTLDEGAS